MKTNMNSCPWLLAAALIAVDGLAAQPTVVEDLITGGPRAGEKIVITNTVAYPPEATVLQKEATIIVGPPNARREVPVELISLRHTFITVTAGITNPGDARCYEFQLRAKDGSDFIWSCWTVDFPRPHRFQVFTTESGKSYACYVKLGVHLFHLTESCAPEAMRRRFWENCDFEFNRPDALPVLYIGWIREALGRASIIHENATTWFVEVLELSDREGELRLTVRGNEPRPRDYSDGRVPPGMRERWLRSRATFALRDRRWELVSATPP